MKRFASLFLAAALAACLCPVSAFAVTGDGIVAVNGVWDEEGDTLDYADFDLSTKGEVHGEEVPPGSRFYVEIVGDGSGMVEWNGGTNVTSVADLVDKDQFTFRLDKDQNGSLVDSVKLVNKRLGGGSRSDYIEVKLKNSRITEEKHVIFDAYFKARGSESLAGQQWQSGDIVNVRFDLFVRNPEEETDAWVETGEGVVFNPTSNEKNLISWGYDGEIASLEFNAASDADKFYAKLSTKIIRSIYDDYGDPADADLYFRTFEGDPDIDSTSRAVLTLYNPWDDDYDYNDRYRYDVDPRDCFLYYVDRHGDLVDMTHQFEYVRGSETDAGVDGWQLRTRSLGTYVISDVELFSEDEPVGEPQNPENLPTESEPTDIPPPKPSGPPPSTGAGDLVAPAFLFAALALGATALARTRR